MTIANLSSQLACLDKAIPAPEAAIQNLCIDSRKVVNPSGSIFFAIRTKHGDGHRYIQELAEKGVCNFVITEPIYAFSSLSKCNFLQVGDTIAALQQVARLHREQFRIPVIGITGSNGKTVVKEWLGTLLAPEHHVVKSPDSYNSQVGVPLSVWQMRPEHSIGIFEAGISRPGEMARIADIIAPTLGVLTNIGMAHAQFFESMEQKLREKLLLFQHAQTIIFHNDDPLIQRVLSEPAYAHMKSVSWGHGEADFIISNEGHLNNSTFVSIQNHTYLIPFVDAASIENACHVIVTMLVLGYAPVTICERLSRLTPVHMRMAIQEGKQHSLIIDDTYSLDRTSLSVALNYLDTQTQLADKTLIISDFEQAGKLQPDDYQQLDALMRQHHIRKLIAVGHAFSQHQDLFHIEQQYFYPDTGALLAHLPAHSFVYEAILIKGARSFHFEEVVNQLLHKTHLTTLHVSLPAIVHNLQYFKSFLKKETKMVAMVKALSYGLGDAEIINELTHQHIDYLAVAYTDEGVRLRKRHIETPIIVLGAEAHSFEAMVQNRLEPEIFNFYYLQELIHILEDYPEITSFPIHIKFDTGMHRLGFDLEDLPKLAETINTHPTLRIASVFSHLAAADDPAEDDFTRQQIASFTQMANELCGHFSYPILRHILNTAGITRFPEAQCDMVRLGIGLYGFSDLPEVQANLHNVITLKTLITQVKTVKAGETIGYGRSYKVARDMQVAIIPIGYADGYPRELSNGKGMVMVQGKLVPVIGKICMDMCMLDVSGLSVHEGDDVIVYGEGNTVQDSANRIGRISYEMMTAISNRVPRIYVRE